MSYWISLNNPKTNEVATVESFTDGGIYGVGGSTEADLNVTYNYARHFNFRGLHGRKASKTIKKMEIAVKQLGTKRSDDYWDPTEGNTGHTINILLSWAKQFPKYVWDVN